MLLCFRKKTQSDHNIGKMGLVEDIHPFFAECDFRKTSIKLVFIAVSFTFFSAVYLLSTVLSNVTRTYRNLSAKEKIFWHLAIVRGAYGLFCTVFGVWGMFFDTELIKDVIYATSPTSYTAVTLTIGFFVFECGMLLFSDIYYRQFNILLNIHHWLSLFGFTMVIYTDTTHCFGVRGLILEMSTPFSCLCWTLLKAGKAHTLLWKANQFLLVHTFHLRSVAEFYIWYLTYKNWTYIWSDMPGMLFTILYTQMVLVTFVMTPYWTYKKSVQMVNPVDWNFEETNPKKKL